MTLALFCLSYRRESTTVELVNQLQTELQTELQSIKLKK